LNGALPDKWKSVAELYAGCVSGAIQKLVYIDLIEAAGFQNIVLQKDKAIVIPDDILINHLLKEEIQDYKKGNTTISSVTVYAEKPLKDTKSECTPGGGCC
jgi:hypothetical protein